MMVLLTGALGVQPVGAQPAASGGTPGPFTTNLAPKVNGPALGGIFQNLTEVGGNAWGTRSPDVLAFLGKLINVFLGVLALIFLILMLYGGFLWMSAMGDQERITKAKDTIVPAVIGIVIIVGAYAVTSFVIQGLVDASTMIGR